MGGYTLTKTKAEYIGPEDTEYRKGGVYLTYPVKEVPDGSLIAAENSYGEAYVMPARYFKAIEE